MPFHQLRLEVEEIEMAGGARHEELHDPFRLGRPMQHAAQLAGSGEGLVPTEQGRQGDTAETAAGTPEMRPVFVLTLKFNGKPVALKDVGLLLAVIW